MDGRKRADADRPMMVYVLKTGKTNHMGESKAKQTSWIAPDQRSLPEKATFPEKNHKIEQDRNEKTP
jgi:hypothetical protein